MAKRKEEIIREIIKYIRGEGGGYKNWYVGVSQDARNRLFNQHKVEEKKGCWIFRKAFSAEEAREVKKYFVKRLKTGGGPGGGDANADMVYAYKKTSNTNP